MLVKIGSRNFTYRNGQEEIMRKKDGEREKQEQKDEFGDTTKQG